MRYEPYLKDVCLAAVAVDGFIPPNAFMAFEGTRHAPIIAAQNMPSMCAGLYKLVVKPFHLLKITNYMKLLDFYQLLKKFQILVKQLSLLQKKS